MRSSLISGHGRYVNYNKIEPAELDANCVSTPFQLHITQAFPVQQVLSTYPQCCLLISTTSIYTAVQK